MIAISLIIDSKKKKKNINLVSNINSLNSTTNANNITSDNNILNSNIENIGLDDDNDINIDNFNDEEKERLRQLLNFMKSDKSDSLEFTQEDRERIKILGIRLENIKGYKKSIKSNDSIKESITNSWMSKMLEEPNRSIEPSPVNKNSREKPNNGSGRQNLFGSALCVYRKKDSKGWTQYCYDCNLKWDCTQRGEYNVGD
jgi:hypothetical protein